MCIRDRYRREALSKWKSGLGSRATYKALIEVFIKAGKADYADAVCGVLREGVDPSPNPDPTVVTGKGGASGGSQVAATTPESQAQTTSTSTGMDTTEKHCVHCTIQTIHMSTQTVCVYCVHMSSKTQN